MQIELTLKNYRCYPDSSPASLVIDDDWIAIVGINNSGKSSLLRFLFEFRPLFSALASPDTWQGLANGSTIGPNFGNSVRDPIEVFHNLNDRPLSITFSVRGSFDNSQIGSAIVPMSATFEYRRNQPTNAWLTEIILGQNNRLPLGQFQYRDPAVLYKSDVAIDLAPYVAAMDRLRRTFYVGAFRNLLNTGSKADYFDIQVGDAFITRWRNMQTGNTKRENEACEEVTAAIERLFGYQRLSIQAAQTNDTLQLMIDRRPFKLHELGAGIAQFILVLANAAAARPSYILIDEPELNLHPALQIDFLSELAGFSEHGVLFTTHNIGLARATADRIYTVASVAQGVSRVSHFEATHNLPEFLGAMSFSSYQALGFSKVLMVEGPTEVRTVQQFLRKLGKDHQILPLQLGGSSLINGKREYELSELKRITPDLHCVIDSERVSDSAPIPPDRLAFKSSCENLGIRCHILERRAIENYLLDAAIKKVKGDKYRQLSVFEKLTDVYPCWGKNENWKIASAMTWHDIKDTDLGRFLNSL